MARHITRDYLFEYTFVPIVSLMTGHPLRPFDLLALGILPTCVTAVTFGLLVNQVHPTTAQGV